MKEQLLPASVNLLPSVQDDGRCTKMLCQYTRDYHIGTFIP